MTPPDPKRRAFWLKHLHQWHWISSAACLMGMLLFAVTGVTLNHAADIPTQPRVTTMTGRLPDPLREQLAQTAQADEAKGQPQVEPAGAPSEAPPKEEDSKTKVPAALTRWAAEQFAVSLDGRDAEWNDGELYVSLPMPGGDAWLSADLETGDVRYERTDRGWIAYLNDLHKGRNTGLAWRWFIDLFAVSCVVFTITGLFLLQLHAGNRPTTWPLVGLGVVIPLLLAILFIH